MSKKAFFFIDDVIWVFRDLTRQRPASMFDNAFLKVLKEVHDKYGAKVQLNVFYRTDFYYGNDEFTLADMTDAYKAEWEAASDWLKLGFHSKQEFPDYPWVNASYQDVKEVFEMIHGEICRFAGEKTFAWYTVPHWLTFSKEGCRALADCGIKAMTVTTGPVCDYNGDPASLPYGHAGRLLQNRQPETKVFDPVALNLQPGSNGILSVIGLYGYNHIVDAKEQSQVAVTTAPDPDTGMRFKANSPGTHTMNTFSIDVLDEIFLPQMDLEYLTFLTHEQYSYPEYFAYNADEADKIRRACQLAAEHGFTFVHGEELVE